MPVISQAQLQRAYRPILFAFSSLVFITLAATLMIGNASATIRVTPKIIPVSTTFSFVVGPDVDTTTGIVGTVTTSTVNATVTASPSGQGADVPAHASGTVILHNESHATQPLAVGTRLQSTTGVIVRTTQRVDVPAGGTVSVGVVADPLGADGNLQPGRLIIVALRPGNQSIIYGQVVTALTGGTGRASGTLALDDLTKASDEAQAKIRDQVGADQPGHLRLLVPDSVVTTPPATTPSAMYSVTVTMKLREVQFPADQLTERVRQELGASLANDQRLVKVTDVTTDPGDQPTATSIALSVKAQGQGSLAASSSLLQTKNFVGLNRQEIEKKLGTTSVQAVVVHFSPFWRSTAPDHPEKITVSLVGT